MNNPNPYNSQNTSYVPPARHDYIPKNDNYNFDSSDVYFTAYNAESEKKKEELASYVMKWGIISLAFVGSLVLAFLGFAFSFKAMTAANIYVNLYNKHCAKTRIGHILAKVALILGIVFLSLILIFAIIGIESI